jgi:hypothetical protein
MLGFRDDKLLNLYFWDKAGINIGNRYVCLYRMFKRIY